MSTSPAKPRHKLLILDDAVMLSMLKNPEFVTRFPFLRAASQLAQSAPAGGCSSCKGRSRNGAGVNYGGLRAAFNSMSQADKEALRTMLSAERIRVYYPGHRGENVKATF